MGTRRLGLTPICARLLALVILKWYARLLAWTPPATSSKPSTHPVCIWTNFSKSIEPNRGGFHSSWTFRWVFSRFCKSYGPPLTRPPLPGSETPQAKGLYYPPLEWKSRIARVHCLFVFVGASRPPFLTIHYCAAVEI